jgi:hypothetical protein
MRTLALALVAAAFAGSGHAQDAGPPKSTYFDGAKITINERARTDGFMRVRVVPQNGTPREATFAIERRMNENELARGVADALNTVLGPDYVADKDAGEHVKIHKKAKDAANFSVEITFNVPGFAVILDN